MSGGGVKSLIALRTAEISPKHLESVGVLLLRGVGLAKSSLEEREMVVSLRLIVQLKLELDYIGSFFADDDLTDERIVGNLAGDGGEEGEDEEERECEDRKNQRHATHE